MDLSILPRYQSICDELQAAWEDMLDSKSLRVVLLEGGRGSYKTQTIEGFLRATQVPWAAGYGSEVPDPYLPLRQIFESLVRLPPVQDMLAKDRQDIPDDWQMALTSLARLLPMLNLTTDPTWERLRHWQSATVGQVVADEDLDPDQPMRPVTLPGLLTLALGELAALFPFVLLIEDLDQANTATIEAFAMDILPALQNSPVLLIATYAPIDSQPANALSHFKQTALDTPQTRQLALSPLEEQEIVQILSANISGLQEEHLTALAQQVHAGSQGIPTHVNDLVTWLASLEAKTLAANTEVPEHDELIQAQFATLSEDARTVLQIAAVQGEHFCLEAVAKASDYTLQAITEMFGGTLSPFVQLDTTITVQDNDVHWYHFHAPYIQDWMYSTLPDEKRLKLHYDTALALEHLYAEATDAIAGRLAQQFAKGGLPQKAAFYYAAVAHQANDQGAASEALNYVSQGFANLDAADDASPVVRCQLLLEQGRALKGTENSYRAEDILREALDLAQDAQSLHLEIEVKRNLGEVLLSRNVWDEGLDLLKQVINLAAEQKAWKVVANAMEDLKTRYSKRDPQAFLSLCDKMVRMMQEDSSLEALLAIAEILEDKGGMQYYQRKHSESLETLNQAFDFINMIAHPDHYPEIHYKIYLIRVRIFRLLEKYHKSLEEADKAITWAYVSHKRKNIAWARNEKAITLRRMGSEYLEEGEREYEMALKLLHSSSDLTTLAMIEEQYGLFLSYSGYKRRAGDLYAQSYEHRLAANDFHNLQISRNDLAAIDKYLGRFQSSLVTYQQLFSEGLAQGDKHRQSISLNHIGDIYRILNQLDKAEHAHSQAVLLCSEINLGRKVIALRNLARTYLCGWKLSNARFVLDEAVSLSQEKVSISLIGSIYRNKIYLGRLELCESNLSKASDELTTAAKAIRKLLAT